jgi:uncharacterized protein YndB with AHSA1/START domain
MQYGSKDTAGREQRTSLLLEAPLGRVWEVWTKPEHIRHWWGPNGFTNTIEKMEVEPGGEWLFTMHGPDGRAYPNRTIFREVVPYRKLVHEHVDPNFMAVIEFEARDDKTLLHWYKLYETEELFEKVEKEYRASEGFKQTVERLQAYLDGYKIKRIN